MESVSEEKAGAGTEEIVKITVTKEAGDVLNEILAKVNEGFDAGKVNRQDIASFIIEKFWKSFGESEVQLIRKEFFSEKHLLEAILKKAKASGDVPDFLKDALKKHWNGSLATNEPFQPQNRRPARNSGQSKTNDVRKNQSEMTGV